MTYIELIEYLMEKFEEEIKLLDDKNKKKKIIKK
jgi:hypothetical protein